MAVMPRDIVSRVQNPSLRHVDGHEHFVAHSIRQSVSLSSFVEPNCSIFVSSVKKILYHINAPAHTVRILDEY